MGSRRNCISVWTLIVKVRGYILVQKKKLRGAKDIWARYFISSLSNLITPIHPYPIQSDPRHHRPPRANASLAAPSSSRDAAYHDVLQRQANDPQNTTPTRADFKMKGDTTTINRLLPAPQTHRVVIISPTNPRSIKISSSRFFGCLGGLRQEFSCVPSRDLRNAKTNCIVWSTNHPLFSNIYPSNPSFSRSSLGPSLCLLVFFTSTMPFTPDPYFKSDPRRWTPELFGAACLGKTPDYSLQRILDGYVKSLTKISLDQRTTERRRKKAEHLVEQYREVLQPPPLLCFQNSVFFISGVTRIPGHSRLFAELQN